jgi:hypothetical protein
MAALAQGLLCSSHAAAARPAEGAIYIECVLYTYPSSCSAAARPAALVEVHTDTHMQRERARERAHLDIYMSI